MNVLHLISSGGFYGAENVVAALADGLQRVGYSVWIGILDNEHSPENDVAEQFERRGLKVIRIPCRSRVDRQTVRRIREAIRQNQIELLHTHGYKADIYGYFAVRRLNLSLVATCHNWTRQTAAVRAYELLDIFFLRKFDSIIAVSDAVAEALRRAGIAPAQIETIDNGVDLSSFDAASPGLADEIEKGHRLLVGTVGRLAPKKGMDYFLRAAAEALKEIPALLFALVGDGPEIGELKQLAKSLGIEESVSFTGQRADMPSVYASFDVFVLASLNEGMSMVALEALASARPAIVTEVGALPKLVRHEETGLLVQPADVEGLAQAILSLVRNPELRARLGRNGKAWVQQRFSAQVMAQNYSRVYEGLLKEKGSALDSVALKDSQA